MAALEDTNKNAAAEPLGASRMLEVTTLGEGLVVMDPAARGPLRQVGLFEKRLGGAELNVAVALSRLGHGVGWSGRLGDDEFGHEILSLLRGEEVDVSGVSLDPDAPTGVYFKERRALDRLRVYYYRSGSAASRMTLEQLDFDHLLSGRMLHLTGITPAVSENCHELVRGLVNAAAERGVPVSFDANIRWRLFGGRDPREVLSPLIARAEVAFFTEEEAELLLGTSEPGGVMGLAPGQRPATVVVHGPRGAFAVEADSLAEEPSYPVSVVDTVGAGDAFVAGFISARLRGWDLSQALRLANACGACAVTVPGDVESMPAREEALSLMENRSAVER